MTDPRTTILRLYVLGAVLLVAGGYLAAVSWPAEIDQVAFAGTADEVTSTVQDGSVFLAAVGAAVAVAGQVALLVATIASGVRLGRRN